MIPFDGEFAEKTVLPLAITAYSATWNTQNDPVLATIPDYEEILVDTSDGDFQKMIQKPGMSGKSKSAFARMRNPGAASATGTAAPVDGSGQSDFAAVPVPVNDRFGWVCRDGERLIVTFRGTQTGADWLDNLDFIGEPYLPVPGRGTVHQGFQLVYYSIRKNLLALVNKLAPGCTELLVVGHSLGGALATLAMPDLLNGPMANCSPILYNLASPRAGHDDFQNFFDSHVNVCYRIVNQWDVVPHLPPTLAGYVHVGNQLTIDSGFSLDIVKNHVLATGYEPGLDQWNEKHTPTQTAKLGTFALATSSESPRKGVKIAYRVTKGEAVWISLQTASIQMYPSQFLAPRKTKRVLLHLARRGIILKAKSIGGAPWISGLTVNTSNESAAKSVDVP